MRSLILAAFVAGLVLLALLYLTGKASTGLTEALPALFLGGGLLGLLLLVLLGWRMWWLQNRIRRGVFGAKLTLRLLVMFGAVSLLPVVVVYGASVFFLNRSIETWFDVRVDTALGAGVNLGQAAIDDLLTDLDKKAQRIALTLSDAGVGALITLMSTLREQSTVQELTLFDERGGVVAHVGGERGQLLPLMPERGVLWQVRQQQPYRGIEETPDRGLVMRVLVPVYPASIALETRVLQLVQPVPASLARDAQAVQEAYREYQQIALSRQGLKQLYGAALTLTLLLALLMTFVIATLLSERLGAPLRTLARGTRAVAKGDFSEMPAQATGDELGVLIQSFNRMTRQLGEAREQAAHNHRQTEQARAFLEHVLASLSSGVIVLDDLLRIRVANAAAAQMLGANQPLSAGLPLAGLGEAESAQRRFAERAVAGLAGDTPDWQDQVELSVEGVRHVLLVRGTRLPEGVECGYVLVFDDVTALIDAERNAAWSEVARRLAHEIKNPLTPIQLSAERIARKLEDRLAPAEAEFVARATQTIVNQVAAMKQMVDAFAHYARTPRARLAALDLNALVGEVLSLYEGRGIQTALAAGLPPVAGDATLLRQVIHNLLQNAFDALSDCADPRILVRTKQEGDMVCFSVDDNGSGFSEQVMSRLFEPYATTKPKGTGLGLAVVKKIVEEHKGKIAVDNREGGGAVIRIALPVYRAEAMQA